MEQFIFKLLMAAFSAFIFSSNLFATELITASKDTVCKGETVELEASTSGMTYKWSTGETDQIITVSPTETTTYSVTVSDGSIGSITISVQQAFTEQIAVTTYNQANTGVVTVWEQTQGKGTKSYELWRSLDSEKEWALLTTAAFADSSYYVDTDESVFTAPYKYKLITIDSVCNYREESAIHRPMFMSMKENADGSVLFECTDYEGIEHADYQILSYLGQIETELASVPIVYYKDIYTYTFRNHFFENDYRMSMKLPKTITVSDLKTNSGPFSHSISNIAEIDIELSLNEDDKSISVYPLYTNDYITIKPPYANTYNVSVYSVSSQKVIETWIDGETQIPVDHLKQGTYFLNIIGADNTCIKQFVVE